MSNNNQRNNRQQHNNNQKGGGNNRPQHASKRNSRAAEREMRRNQDDARRMAGFDDVVTDADKARLAMNQKKANQLDNGSPRLKVTPLGGQDEVGSKNMTVIEYGDDAIVVDCGFALGLDLPGINYGVNDITYLESIKHKVRGYVFTHGHLDHIGGTPFVLPKIPAPIYGSTFTLGMVEKQIKDSDMDIDYEPESIPMNIDNHERLKVGPFFVELVRVTHSIPDSSAAVIDTPVGRIIHTGDFRLDPEPLDKHPTDLDRLKELGKEDVLLLLAESSNTESPGRTATEHTLEQSFHDILHQSSGRVLVSTFSSNINRLQMILNASVESGRKVAIDGRSMLATVELAFKLGYMKIPQGTIVSMKEIANIDDRNVTVVCTGSQGEPNAALQRMSMGTHNHVKLKESDTVILSSNPIPGNEVAVMDNVDRLMRTGASVFRNRTHELDGCGPLHVSGHGNREELKEMLEMTTPKYVMPNHGPFVHRKRYIELAQSVGMDKDRVVLIDNGDMLEFDEHGKMHTGNTVPAGTVLVDQTGSLVPNLVIKDRLLMADDGIVVVVLTVDKQSKRLLSSPDIVSRGFIHMQERTELVGGLRDQIRDFTNKRIRKSDLKQFKQDLRDEVSSFLYHETQRAPMVIPVVNLAGAGGNKRGGGKNPRNNNRPKQDSHKQNQ